jgi:hypothetical protein
MAVENVVCPNCGSMQYANVPGGQRVLKIVSSKGRYRPDENERENENICKECSKVFYSITVDL